MSTQATVEVRKAQQLRASDDVRRLAEALAVSQAELQDISAFVAELRARAKLVMATPDPLSRALQANALVAALLNPAIDEHEDCCPECFAPADMDCDRMCTRAAEVREEEALERKAEMAREDW